MIYVHPFQGAHCFRRSVPRATLRLPWAGLLTPLWGELLIPGELIITTHSQTDAPLALGWFTNAPLGRIAHPRRVDHYHTFPGRRTACPGVVYYHPFGANSSCQAS